MYIIIIVIDENTGWGFVFIDIHAILFVVNSKALFFDGVGYETQGLRQVRTYY